MATETLEAPVTEVKKAAAEAPATVPLSKGYQKALEEQAPVQEVKKEVKKEDTKVEKQPDAKVVKEVEKTEAKKPASPLDAVLEKPVEKIVEKQPDEPAADAPAKLLREAYERQKSEAARWKGEAEKASKGDPVVKSQLESIRAEKEKLAKENAELRDAITAVNVEYDPEVRAKYHDGKAAMIVKTTKAVEQFGGDAKAFGEAMALPAGKPRTQAIKDALSEVDEMDRTEIYNKIAKVRELEEEHAELLQNSQKSYADLTKRQQERALEQQAHAEKAKGDIFSGAAKALPEQHPTIREVPNTVEGHEEWNARLKSDHEQALKLLSPDATLEEISAAAIKGARYDFVESLLLDERAVTKQLREELAKYQGSEPGFDGRHKSDKTSNADRKPSERYHAKLEELKGRSED